MTVNEDGDIDEFLDSFCWSIAATGENFFPPDETAERCAHTASETYTDAEMPDEMKVWKFLENYGWEKGQHTRAWSNAVVTFLDMKRWGLDPVGRAERFADHDGWDHDYEPSIDWTWLRETNFEFDDDE